MELMRPFDHSKFQWPIPLTAAQQQYFSSLQYWWNGVQQSELIRALSHPMNQSSTISTASYILHKLVTATKQTNVIYLVDCKLKRDFFLKTVNFIYEKYFNKQKGYLVLFGNSYQVGRQISQLVVSTFQDFVVQDLPKQNFYNYMIVETSNFVRIVNDSFRDYITQTYLRRAYLESLRYLEAYKQLEKASNKNGNMQKQKSQSLQLINLISKESNGSVNGQKKQSKEIAPEINVKKIKKTFENKKDNFIKSKNNKEELQNNFFQKNELVLLSGIVYLIGFFSSLLHNKKTKNLLDFLEEFEKKTFVSINFLQNVISYLEKIYNNCPKKPYKNLKSTYLYSLCNFAHKLTVYKTIFPQQFFEFFEVRVQKFYQERKDSIYQQSNHRIGIFCQDESKIYLKILSQKSRSSIIIQNMVCPENYWHHFLRKKNILIKSPSISNSVNNNIYSRIFGLHISKTPSNQDINFAQKLKGDIQTIKIKACGVLLHDLSKFVPDGIIVYFHSAEGLENFSKQMDKEQEKILKRIDNNKKIFVESIFEEENNENFIKYKKCCELGRGAIFFISANGKAAQNMKFYHHLSRCIVFFGLPKVENEIKRQRLVKKDLLEFQQEVKQLEQQEQSSLQKIAVYNECINNCVNDLSDYKSIIFVGREITNDLQSWYKSFIRSWDETTRQSLMKLRHHFQKMGGENFK